MTTTTTTHEKFAQMRADLNSALIERETEIDLCLTAMVAQEHCLFVGPPGTAKSLLCDTIAAWIGTRSFYWQLSKFTTPEELFGPVSLAGLKNDQYRRVPTGKLPEATIVVLDEFWNASSAIVNTLQRCMNERLWANDGQTIHLPLKMLVAGSNRWPGAEEKEVGAIFDRFLFRCTVKPIASARGIDRLLWSPDLQPQLSTSIAPEEIDEACADAGALPWTDGARSALLSILRDAKQEGIIPGDRRLRKSVKAARAYAWLQGHAQVETDDLEVLAHVLWDDPTEQPQKLAQIVGKIANPEGMRINSLLIEAEQIISATDLRDLSQTASACKKLAAIHGKLAAAPGSRAQMAAEHVASEVKRIRLASVEAL